MRQIKLSNPGGLKNLQLVQSPKPSPGEGQILIKVFASSLNYHDLLVALGRIPTQDGRVILSDCAGAIEEVGHGVTKWQAGDQVISCC